jgi:hypothetical protein
MYGGVIPAQHQRVDRARAGVARLRLARPVEQRCHRIVEALRIDPNTQNFGANTGTR